MPVMHTPTDEDYAHLLALRTGLRRFLGWSERRARAAGLTPAQHQLLLAIRGHDEPQGPTISQAAAYLQLRHNSAVELVDRAVAAGLISREPDAVRGSVVRLRLTEAGKDSLEALSELHLEELAHLAPTMQTLLTSFVEDSADQSDPDTPPSAATH
jgi:DNA-binding MarR family transcriptional regulator